MLGVETYVLRFWEKEFPQLQPKRTRKGQRIYSEEDVQLLKKIIYLLYKEGLSIEGAKKRLSNKRELTDIIEEVKEGLIEIRRILKT